MIRSAWLRSMILVAGLLTVASPASAQTPPPEPSVDTVEDIVVVARRSGAPVWRVRNGDATVILVGSVASVPVDTPWQPEALEAAVAQADAVILSQTARMRWDDYFRFRRARARLPVGTTTADYLPTDLQTRLAALEQTYRRDYATRGLVWIAEDLIGSRFRYPPGFGPAADDVVRAAASRFRKPVDEVGRLDGRHLDDAVSGPGEAQLACLTAAITAMEAGADGFRALGLAWTRREVPAVLSNPIEQVSDVCNWSADQTLRVEGRAQWSEAVAKALLLDRTTVVVAPISLVAEPAGLLDQMEDRGLQVSGPDWKAE